MHYNSPTCQFLAVFHIKCLVKLSIAPPESTKFSILGCNCFTQGIIKYGQTQLDSTRWLMMLTLPMPIFWKIDIMGQTQLLIFGYTYGHDFLQVGVPCRHQCLVGTKFQFPYELHGRHQISWYMHLPQSLQIFNVEYLLDFFWRIV